MSERRQQVYHGEVPGAYLLQLRQTVLHLQQVKKCKVFFFVCFFNQEYSKCGVTACAIDLKVKRGLTTQTYRR